MPNKSFKLRIAALASLSMLLAACEARPSSEFPSSNDTTASNGTTTSEGNTNESSTATESSINPNAPRIVNWYDLKTDAVFDTTKEVTIKFWHRMGAQSQALVQQWIQEFKILYPNITVTEEKVANDYTAIADKVALSITAGTEPDIVESYPDHVARYAQAKSPLALNNFINHPTFGLTQAEQDDFLPGLWREGRSYDNAGTILSLPFTKSTEGFFYNKKYFETHGYSVPRTWDEVFAIAADIKSREANAIPFGYDSEDNLFITAAKQWDAPYTGYNNATGRGEVLFNNTKAKEMVKYFKDKVDRGLMITRALNADAYTSDIFKTNQKLYMYVGSTGGTRYAYIGANNAFDSGNYSVGVAPIPSKDLDRPAQIQQGPNITLLRKVNNEHRMIAAWLFAKYMTSAEKSAQFSIPSGYAPIRFSSYETVRWNTYVSSIVDNPTNIEQAQEKLVKEAIEMFLDYSESFFTSAVFNLSSKTRTEVGALIVKIFAYNATSPSDLDNYINAQFQESYDFIVN
jgi:multiple sugar transport system substrate-binding protein